MYTSIVIKEPRPVCTSQPSVQHDVQHFNSLHEQTSSGPLTLLEAFLSMDTPPEFVSLDLLDCRAPGEVGGRVSFCLDNWQVITQDA